MVMLQGLRLMFPYITKRVVYVVSVDDIVTLLTSDYPYIQRMSKVTQEQLNSFGNCSKLSFVCMNMWRVLACPMWMLRIRTSAD